MLNITLVCDLNRFEMTLNRRCMNEWIKLAARGLDSIAASVLVLLWLSLTNQKQIKIGQLFQNVRNRRPKMPENDFNKISTLWTCQTYMENMSRVLKPEEILFGVLFFGKSCVSYGSFWNNCPIIIAIWWWDEQTCLQRRTRFVWTSVASFSKVAFFCVKMGFLGYLFTDTFHRTSLLDV